MYSYQYTEMYVLTECIYGKIHIKWVNIFKDIYMLICNNFKLTK